MILPPPTTAALLYARNELKPQALSWRPLGPIDHKATRPTKRPGRRVGRKAVGVRKTGETVTVPVDGREQGLGV